MKECSQEPLEAVGSCIRTKRTADGGGIFVADCYRKWEEPVEFAFDGTAAEAYASRLVQCFNDCLGIVDPAAEIARLRADNDEINGACTKRQLEIYNLRAEIAKLWAEREELQRRIDTYERAWLAENGRACNLFDKVGTLSQLLERHLADNADGERNRCNCQLCIDTRAALAEKGE